MFDRQHQRLIFECDFCGQVVKCDSDDFVVEWAQLKQDGWTAKQQPGGSSSWVHRCGECAAAP